MFDGYGTVRRSLGSRHHAESMLDGYGTYIRRSLGSRLHAGLNMCVGVAMKQQCASTTAYRHVYIGALHGYGTVYKAFPRQLCFSVLIEVCQWLWNIHAFPRQPLAHFFICRFLSKER